MSAAENRGFPKTFIFACFFLKRAVSCIDILRNEL
jgi:hypothetical protein